MLDALRRLGSFEPSSSSAEGGRSARFASMRSRLAGTVPEENRWGICNIVQTFTGLIFWRADHTCSLAMVIDLRSVCF